MIQEVNLLLLRSLKNVWLNPPVHPIIHNPKNITAGVLEKHDTTRKPMKMRPHPKNSLFCIVRVKMVGLHKNKLSQRRGQHNSKVAQRKNQVLGQFDFNPGGYSVFLIRMVIFLSGSRPLDSITSMS